MPIDEAREYARTARRNLSRFKEELADADQRLHVSLDDIGGFTTFADYFFDGLIVDWMVQSKLNQAQTACQKVLKQVNGALAQCQQALKEVEAQVQKIRSERQQFIEQA